MCFPFFATCAVELVQLPFPHSQMLVIASPPDFHLDPATVLLARFPLLLSPDSSASPRNGLSQAKSIVPGERDPQVTPKSGSFNEYSVLSVVA